MTRITRTLALATAATILTAVAASATEAPIKVFLLAGQSNMEGQGVVSMDHPQHYNGDKDLSPNTGHDHHWFGNAESYFLVGDALGKAMVEMLD